jgi:dynein heavy chain 2
LCKPDKYDTIQLIAFLQQLVCYKGFYDDNLEFVNLERIQIIASMNPATTIGRHKLSSRFTANVRIAYTDYAPTESLELVYTEYMRAILNHPTFGQGAMSGSSKKLARFVVDTYAAIKSKFPNDEHRHYLFTPREVTEWIFGLMRYEATTAQPLIESLIYENFRIFRDRLVDKESKTRLESIVYQGLRQHLKFNDKLTSTYFLSKVGNGSSVGGSPALGRLNREDLINLIQQSLRQYEREFKELKLIVIEEVLDLVACTERVFSRPGGCLLLAGVSGIGRRSCSQLVANILQIEFYTPNISRDYSIKEFKRDLKVVLGQAGGIDDKKILFYMEDHQMITIEFLEFVNSLISAGEVPGLYSPEELEPILSTLNDEFKNQYECRTLFEFFTQRIKKNLHIVLSLDC